MTKLLKTNGAYGAKVAGRIVFTKESALHIYRLACEVCLTNMKVESAYALSLIADDMVKIGFDLDYLEQVEIEVMQAM